MSVSQPGQNECLYIISIYFTVFPVNSEFLVCSHLMSISRFTSVSFYFNIPDIREVKVRNLLNVVAYSTCLHLSKCIYLVWITTIQVFI